MRDIATRRRAPPAAKHKRGAFTRGPSSPVGGAPPNICGSSRRTTADGTATRTDCCGPDSRSRLRTGALLQVPQSDYPSPGAQVDPAIAFLKRNTRSDGMAGMMAPDIPDYPNYSTALTITRWSVPIAKSHTHGGGPAEAAVRRTNGWKRADSGVRRVGHGEAHLECRPIPATWICSMTRYVIDALRARRRARIGSGIRASAHFRRALPELRSARSRSRGWRFFSFPLPSSIRTRPAMTADTFAATEPPRRTAYYRCSRLAGRSRTIASGLPRGGLSSHHRDMDVPGFVGEAYQRWPRGLAFYYASSSMQAFRDCRRTLASAVAAGLTKTQRPDGKLVESGESGERGRSIDRHAVRDLRADQRNHNQPVIIFRMPSFTRRELLIASALAPLAAASLSDIKLGVTTDEIDEDPAPPRSASSRSSGSVTPGIRSVWGKVQHGAAARQNPRSAQDLRRVRHPRLHRRHGVLKVALPADQRRLTTSGPS